jgi:hypothetical protein
MCCRHVLYILVRHSLGLEGQRALCRIPSEARILLSPEVFYITYKPTKQCLTTLDPSNNAQKLDIQTAA